MARVATAAGAQPQDGQHRDGGIALALLSCAMTLRIEHEPGDPGTILMLIGRISSPDVQQLKARMAEAPEPVALDLEQVRLVDLDAVYFLAHARRRGVELRHLPPYVREWILLENSMAAGVD